MKNVLKNFLKNEKAVFELYSLYERKFKKKTSLWTELLKEEKEHVEILEELFDKYRGRDDKFEVSEYLSEALAYVSKFVSEQKKAAQKRITLFEAAEISLRIEQSMIEKRSFELFRPKDQEILKALKRLNCDTERHAKMIRKDIRKKRNSES